MTQRFCKEVAMWKNLSHPNILHLIGVPDTLEDGKFSMVSEWMANGNIMEYVRGNSGNHLKLVGHNPISFHLLSIFQLADAVEGLEYLHNVNIAHGDLYGVSLSIRISQTSHKHTSCDCLGQHPDYEHQSRLGMSHRLWVHDHCG